MTTHRSRKGCRYAPGELCKVSGAPVGALPALVSVIYPDLMQGGPSVGGRLEYLLAIILERANMMVAIFFSSVGGVVEREMWRWSWRLLAPFPIELGRIVSVLFPPWEQCNPVFTKSDGEKVRKCWLPR